MTCPHDAMVRLNLGFPTQQEWDAEANSWKTHRIHVCVNCGALMLTAEGVESVIRSASAHDWRRKDAGGGSAAEVEP